MTFTGCPDPTCHAPAVVVDRYELPSTAGPVAMVATECARRHHYTTEEPNDAA